MENIEYSNNPYAVDIRSINFRLPRKEKKKAKNYFNYMGLGKKTIKGFLLCRAVWGLGYCFISDENYKEGSQLVINCREL